jgi:hypothetical protein
MCKELKNYLNDADILVDEFIHPKEWVGTLPFPSCRICKQNEPYESIPPESIDLFDFCKGGSKANWYSKDSIVRFDPTLYTVPGKENHPFTQGLAGYQLITDLCSVCHHEGRSSFRSNGSYNGNSCHHINCCHSLLYNSLSEAKEEKEYKDLALRKSNSKSSMPKSKRTVTGQAISNDTKCTAFFVISVDNYSYYMKIGNGNGIHTNHAPHDKSSITMPKRLLPNNVTKNIQALGFFKVSMGSIVTMSQHFHCNITRRQVSNLTNFARMATNVHELDKMPLPADQLSDPDQMIQYFKKSKIPHIVL